MTRVILLVAVLFATMNQAQAGLISFTDRATFDAATGGGLNFESFENPTPNGPVFQLPGFSVSEINGNNFLQRAAGIVTDGSFAAVYFDNGASLLNFQFDQPINAFGFDMAALADTTVTVGGDLTGDFTLANAQPQFIGFFDDMGGTFQNITFSVANTTQLRVDVDSVSFGNATAPVPEPSSLVILGLGAIGFVAAALRRRK